MKFCVLFLHLLLPCIANFITLGTAGTDSSPVASHCLIDYFIRDMHGWEQEKGCAGTGGPIRWVRLHRNKKIKGKRPLPTFQLIIQLFDSWSTSRLSPFLSSFPSSLASLVSSSWLPLPSETERRLGTSQLLVFAFLLTERETLTETWEVLCLFMTRDKPLHVLFLAATELDCSHLYSQLSIIWCVSPWGLMRFPS